MIELHNHLLPGIDDGAADMAMALTMLSQMADQGVSHAFCTPHLSFRRLGDLPAILGFIERCRQVFLQLQAESTQLSQNVTLLLGYEIALTADFFDVLEQLPDPQILGLGRSSYVLVEITSRSFLNTQTLENFLYNFAAAGLQPILAHPERTLQDVDNSFIDHLAQWVQQGRLMLQLNASSVIDLNRPVDLPLLSGYRCRQLTRFLLKNDLVQFVSSDAHDPLRRPPELLAAHDVLSRRFGQRVAQALVQENAAAVVETVSDTKTEG